MDTTITIVGDGAMATVCARLLASKVRTLRLWTPFPEHAQRLRDTHQNPVYLPDVDLPPTLAITTDPAQALARPDLILSAVPSRFLRRWWEPLAPHYPPDAPICSLTKGIETGTLLRPSQVLAAVLGPERLRPPLLAVLSGPCIAREVANGQPATVVAASANDRLATYIQRIFGAPAFRVYTNPDLLGVELAGATKQVIGVAAGILDGLHAGHNAKAALITRGLAEITRLGVSLGAQAETFSGLAGLGDIVTTCTSPHGRNRTFGEAIGRGHTVAEALAAIPGEVEGVPTTKSVLALAAEEGLEMPIARAVAGILFGGRQPRQAIVDLMSRPVKAEGG